MKRTSIFISIYISLFCLGYYWAYGQAQEKHIYDIDVSAAEPLDGVDSVQSAAVYSADMGKTPLSNGQIVDRVIAASQLQQPETIDEYNGTIPPALNLFYGESQHFGHIGNPQSHVNILGNLQVEDNIGTIEYSLNGGQIMTTTIGPDRRRLLNNGDFNIEIPHTILIDGTNQLAITGRDQFAQHISSNVTINYTAEQEWPLPYEADWGNASKISDVAQVVDGAWTLTDTGVQPTALGYDRLIAIGDSKWSDYEATVPLIIKGIDDARGFRFPSLGPGVGIIMDWNGHFQQNNELPFTGWQEFGAIGWYRWSQTDGVTSAGLQMLTYYGREKATDPSLQIEFEVPYMLKMSAQQQDNGTKLYRVKMWESSDPEPLAWNMTSSGDPAAATSGSMLLVSHHVDVEFGTVNAQPLSSIQPKVNLTANSGGSVTIEPNLPFYSYGQVITVKANAEVGQVVEWQGDLQGNDSEQQITLTKDLDIIANFISAEPLPLAVSVAGSGKVLASPEQTTYPIGSLVTLTAVADDGYRFTGWNGTLNGTENPIQFVMSPGKEFTATFTTRSMLTPPISDDFNSCLLDNDLWTLEDPIGDVTLSQSGTQAIISIPGGTDHDLWTEKNFAPRIIQPMADGDFMAEVKFQTVPTQRFQMQGLIVEQDDKNFLRFDVFHSGTELRLFAAIFDNTEAQPTVRFNEEISSDLKEDSDIVIRVQHFDDRWRLFYSFDGSNWIGPKVTFEHPLVVKQIGVFAGNTASNDDIPPAYEAKIDYFYNSIVPLTPEDFIQNQITVNTIGNGSGTVNVSSAQQNSTEYTCGEIVTLTAQPSSNARFVRWSGSGIDTTDNPARISITGGLQTVTAEFETAMQAIFLPFVVE
ncbi:MAG: hypothetical protein AAF702_33770 [Chloroflexota bacterium]